MRVAVQLEGVAGGYRLRLTESQYRLLVNSLSALKETVNRSSQLDLVLGRGGRALTNLLFNAERAEIGSRFILEVTDEEAHSIYALLANLPDLFSTEESYYLRIGAFRENSKAIAAGFLSAVSDVDRES